MNIKQIRKALTLFANENATKAQRHHNVRAWLKAMAQLGDRHILATHVQRKA